MRHRVVAFLTVLFAAGASAQAVDFNRDIQPVITALCSRCHGEAKQKGGVNFALVTDAKSALKQRKMLKLAVAAIEAGDMPPEDEKQPTAAQRQMLVAWMTKASVFDCNDPSQRDPGPWPARRLNRAQYDLTIRDLVGIEFSSADAVGLPDDLPVTGYSTYANALTLPGAQMEKYFAAAERVLEVVFAGDAEAQAKGAYAGIFTVVPSGTVTAREAAKRIIEPFARRAFRRPVGAEEVERLLKLFDASQSRGDKFEAGVRLMLKSVLVSPHFLLRIEPPPAVATSTAPLPVRASDHALAVRLSYFLWASMPDAELTETADAKKLSAAPGADPAAFDAQAKRMLADTKSRALTDQFAAQWLQLHKLENARPSTEFFPKFNRQLRAAMREETLLFFDNLRTENRPIVDLLDSNYTFMNEPLSRHYGVFDVTGTQMRRVALTPDQRRGGLLGMGAILAMTSHTSRTSPTLRGKWVLDVIYGTPPPPPPPDVGEIKEDGKSKQPKSFRELLAQHANRAECAACHKKMDPLGFALDNFDAVGAWRDTHGGRPLDTTGKLPTGESFSGAAELKKTIVGQKDRFVRNLTEQMLSYALGRELAYFDECAVNEIVKALEQDGFRFSTLVHGVVKSYPFQHRRASDD